MSNPIIHCNDEITIPGTSHDVMSLQSCYTNIFYEYIIITLSEVGRTHLLRKKRDI